MVSNKIIADSFLSGFSFLGQRKKKNFSVFGNITKLIVLASMDAYNKFIDNKFDDGDDEEEAEVPKTEAEVALYFKSKFLKYADQRAKRKKK